jgi:hypothetical protein
MIGYNVLKVFLSILFILNFFTFSHNIFKTFLYKYTKNFQH